MKPVTSIFIAAFACLVLVGGWMFWSQPPPERQPVMPNVRPPVADEPEQQPEQDFSHMLHPKVRLVISREAVGIEARHASMKTLPHNLAGPDIQALMDFINGEKPEDVRVKEWHALIDGLINNLRVQEADQPSLSRALVRLYSVSADPVLKGYALQYLIDLFDGRGDALSDKTDPQARTLILDTLMDAASRTSESYSGTALIGLHQITSSYRLGKDPETQALIKARMGDVNAAFIKAACSPTTDKHCRITVLQLCAMQGLNEILPTARELAADSKADPNIRISAIAAIGQLGSLAEDEVLLKQLEQEGLRLAAAATPALAKLSNNTQ